MPLDTPSSLSSISSLSSGENPPLASPLESAIDTNIICRYIYFMKWYLGTIVDINTFLAVHLNHRMYIQIGRVRPYL